MMKKALLLCILGISGYATAGELRFTFEIENPANCQGEDDGEITVNVQGGVAPYTVNVTGQAPQTGASPFTFDDLAAGSYQINVTDSAGNAAGPETALVPLFLVETSTTPANSSGTGGSITITVENGIAPYVFTLNGEASDPQNDPSITFGDLAAGDYTITALDGNGCFDSNPIVIVESSLSLVIDSITPANCSSASANDGTITVTAVDGIAPYTFAIDNNVQPSTDDPTFTFVGVAAGDHSVSVTDASGEFILIDVTVPASDLAFTSSVVNVNFANDTLGSITVVVTGGEPPYTVEVNGEIQTSAPFVFDGLNVADYTITVTDSNGCVRTGCNTVLSDNDLRNATFLKYCSNC